MNDFIGKILCYLADTLRTLHLCGVKMWKISNEILILNCVMLNEASFYCILIIGSMQLTTQLLNTQNRNKQDQKAHV